MSDWKLYGKCDTCPRKRFFVRKRSLKLHQMSSLMAKSQKLMCGHCYRAVLKMLSTNDATN